MKLLLHGITAALKAGSAVLLSGSVLFSPLQRSNLKFRNYLWYRGDKHNLLSYFFQDLFLRFRLEAMSS